MKFRLQADENASETKEKAWKTFRLNRFCSTIIAEIKELLLKLAENKRHLFKKRQNEWEKWTYPLTDEHFAQRKGGWTRRKCGARGENERKNLCDWQNENLMNARNRVE